MGSDDDIGGGNTANVERQEISQLVKCRMSSLGLPLEDYGKTAYVLPSLVNITLHGFWKEHEDYLQLLRGGDFFSSFKFWRST